MSPRAVTVQPPAAVVRGGPKLPRSLATLFFAPTFSELKAVVPQTGMFLALHAFAKEGWEKTRHLALYQAEGTHQHRIANELCRPQRIGPVRICTKLTPSPALTAQSCNANTRGAVLEAV